MAHNPKHVSIVRKGIVAIEEWRQRHPNTQFDLSNSSLMEVDLSRANLSGANFYLAVLSKADFSKADLSGVFFVGCDLSGANLSEAHLNGAILCWARLFSSDFTNAKMGWTAIGGCNLAQAKGLETIEHNKPSSIGMDTLMDSFRGAGNRLTSDLETFFINAGVPRELLEALPRIIADVKYCTAFVCYGQPDLVFAKKLVKDLKAKGVQCWLYPFDYTPGERTWKEIGLKRREADKMIVLCSAESLVRDGVLKEIEEQIDEDPDKIFPLSLNNLWKEDGFLLMRGRRNLKPFLIERNYVDFSNKSNYEDALKQLLKGIERKNTN